MKSGIEHNSRAREALAFARRAGFGPSEVFLASALPLRPQLEIPMTKSTLTPDPKASTIIPLFSKEALPDGEFSRFSKRYLTRAQRINGPFAVLTRDGRVDCPDGYLALDHANNPYPIAADEFVRLWEPAEFPELVSNVVQADPDETMRWRTQERANWFAQAILQNPQLERFVLGDPLERRRCGDYASVGEFLAHHAWRLAEDYERAVAILSSAPRQFDVGSDQP